MKCWNCDSEKDFESKKSLRMHQISSGEYDKDEFNKKVQEMETDKDGGSSKSSSDGSSSNLDDLDEATGDNNSDSDSSSNNSDSSDDKLMDVSSSETTNLDDLISQGDKSSNSDSSDEDSTSTTSRKGLDTAINDGWGRIATIDLDPEDEETSNMRKNIAGLAQDVGLGQNVKWYYEEELKGDTDDPKKALMGSLIMAMVMTLTVRPELAQKIQKEVKNNRSSTPDTTDNKEEEE